MRLLAVCDFHNTFDRLPDILKKAGKVDGTLLAGDLDPVRPDRESEGRPRRVAEAGAGRAGQLR